MKQMMSLQHSELLVSPFAHVISTVLCDLYTARGYTRVSEEHDARHDNNWCF